MNTSNKNKAEINLKSSINTDTVDQDIYAFGDTEAPAILNTGIERDGGITNIYEKEETYSEAGEHIITETGDTVSIITSGDFRTIKINSVPVGSVSAYGVEKRFTVSAVDDIFLTSTSYVTSKLIGNTITLTEYDYNQTQLNTRNITFPNLTTILTYFTSISIVKYNGQKYADSQEWCLRLGSQIIILQESNPGITVTKAFGTTSALGSSTVNASALFNGWLIVAGDSGRVASFDGQNWKNYDGTGTGVGIYDNGNVIGTNNIYCLANYSYGGINYLVVAGAGGRIGSYSNQWNVYNSGLAISDNGTVVSTDDVKCLYVWNPYSSSQFANYLVVGGSAGKLGSWNGTAWTLYNAGSGLCDNATLIGTNSINGMAKISDRNGVERLVVAGNGGRIANADFTPSTSGAFGTFTTTPAPGGLGWFSVTYGNGLFVALALTTSTTAGIATSPDGITWTFRTTTAPAGNWRSVAYGNGLFVAVAQTTSTTAGIATSPDGITWNFTTTPSIGGAGWQSVTYGNGLFVAVSGTTSTTAGIATSPDGITWTFRTTTAPAGNWNSVTYGNGLFVATSGTASTTAGIATSPDGITWTFRTTPTPGGGWQSVTYGNGLFVALVFTTSTTAGIATSPDGITWTFRTTTAPAGNWRSVAYGNGLFVAGAGTTSTTAGIATSPDGITWTFRTNPAPGAGWYSVCYGNGLFVALSLTTSTTAGIMYNLDSVFSKNLYTNTNSINGPTSSSQLGGNNILSVANYSDGVNKTSAGGSTWNFTTTPAPAAGWQSVCYGNGLFVAVAYTNSTTAGLATSPDGITWTFRTTPAPVINWISVCYGNGLFVAAARSSTTECIAISTDGITWTFQNLPSIPSGSLRYVTYGNGLFIVGAGGASTTTSLATSPDGITWTFRTLPAAPLGGWNSITYGNGLFVALASNTSTTQGIATSPDGITWTFRTTTAPGGSWQAVTYGNGLFVAVAYTNSTTAGIATSPDGITWTFRTTTAPAGNWQAVTYGNGLFVAVAATTSTTAGIATSPDGITWTFRTTTAPGGSWISVCYGGGKFVAVAYTTATTNAIAYSNTDPFVHTNNLVVAGAGGRLSTYDGVDWSYWGDPVGINSTAVLGSNAINSLVTNGTTLVASGDGGTIGSYDGTAWKNYDASGSGTGPYSNATTISSNNIKTSIYYGTSYIFGGANGNINSINSTDFTFLGGFNNFGYLYTYRYENGLYLTNLVGNANNQSFIFDNSTKVYNTIAAKYVVPQVSSGKTRHIVSAEDLSTQHIYTGSAITCIGSVGYTDFNTFSNTVVYPSAPYALSSVLHSNSGFGYADFTFKTTSSATNIYNYIPQPYNNQTSLYQVTQGNTDTLVNSYGRLTNIYGVVPSVPLEFRVGLINGQQSYISAALLDGSTIGTVGVTLTNIGDFDDTYLPQTNSDSILLYKDAEGFFNIVKVGKTSSSNIQKINDGVYKLNTISPQNILDTKTRFLTTGSLDYNNRMVWFSSVAPTTSTKFASVIYDSYSNSIDTGDKLVTIVAPTTSSYEILAYRIPYIQNQNYQVDMFIDDVYLASTLNDGSELIVSSKADTEYIESAIVCPAIGYTYNSNVLQTGTYSIFLNSSGILGTTSANSEVYDGYALGNEVYGTYTPFVLQGQTYLFDGINIYLANFSNNVYSSKYLIAAAQGMMFVGLSPINAYFLSPYDNSLYTFDGGRNLTKIKRLNKKPQIIQGAFNIRDNELLLDTASSLIFIRDNVATENQKKATQSDLKLYTTADGLIVGNNTGSWKYTYYPESGSTVVPLVWQSAHFGQTTNEKSILSHAVFTIYNANKSAQTIKATIYAKDENDKYYVQSGSDETINIQPSMYNDQGYYTFRLFPEKQRSVALSIKLVIPEKTVLYDACIAFADAEEATRSAKNTR